MIYKEYGNTGKKVSAVGFGGMRFDLTQSMQKNADIVKYAFENGITYFDTAPGYSEDKSEPIFGLAFKDLKSQREKFSISTKAMPTSIETEKQAVEAVEKSIKRLNVEKIDFYHVWCVRKIDHYKKAIAPGAQYDGLLKCQQKGLIDNICISTHLPGNKIETIVKEKKFSGILIGVNILNFQYRWQGLKAAHDAKMGTVAMNPIAGGLIPKHENEFKFLSTNKNETPTEAALRFTVSCPQITVSLNGFTTKHHIDTACKVADNCKPFSQEDIEQIKKNLSRQMDYICTGCGYCANVCPKGIPVPNYMQYYNDKILFNKPDEEMIKQLNHDYNWGILVDRIAGPSDCIQCRKCQIECTQHLNIIERLQHIEQYEKQMFQQHQQ